MQVKHPKVLKMKNETSPTEGLLLSVVTDIFKTGYVFNAIVRRQSV